MFFAEPCLTFAFFLCDKLGWNVMTFEFTNLQIKTRVRASTGRCGLGTYTAHLLTDVDGFRTKFFGCFGILFQVQVVSGNGFSEHR